MIDYIAKSHVFINSCEISLLLITRTAGTILIKSVYGW